MVTKNLQTNETIIKMVHAAFPERKVAAIKELTEGMCNVTYCLTFCDGSESILKIASRDTTGNTSNEVHLMQAEVRAMELVAEKTDIRIPRVLYYDTSKSICDGNYFFMEKLKGDNYIFVKDSMTQDQIDEISTEVGCIEKKLTQITNPQFGFLGDESRYDELYDFVKKMLTNLIHDAKARKIDIVYDGDTLLAELERNREAFSEIKEATLVHWDLWEGNVFIKDGDVSGIIDWERAMWGEALMDDRFRHHNKNDAFLIGFGKESFTEKEKIRLRWYDIILYLTMMIEVFYREFEDKGQYDWARGMLVEVY